MALSLILVELISVELALFLSEKFGTFQGCGENGFEWGLDFSVPSAESYQEFLWRD